MKSPYFLSFLLAVALLVMSLTLFFTSKKTDDVTTVEVATANVDTASIVLNNIYTRTSIRDYTSEPVSEEQITALLRAAMAAPTARNRQPWQFVVVDDRATLDRFVEVSGGMSMAAKAPLAIVVCATVDPTIQPANGCGHWVQDASAATENILLAAHALQLGAVWTSVYPVEERLSGVIPIVELPSDVTPLNVIFIGHPAEDPAPKDKWKPEKIHRNHW